MAKQFKNISALAYFVILAGCGSGGSDDNSNGTSVNGISVVAERELIKGSSEENEYIEPEKIVAKQSTISYFLNEDFSEIEAETGAFTDAMFSQLTTKTLNFATLRTESVSGEAKYTPSGQAVYHKYNVTFELDNVFCDSYELGVTYSRSDYWGRRDINIVRLNDNYEIQPTLDVSTIKSKQTTWYTLPRISNEAEKIQISGYKSKLFQVQIKSTCDRLDSDSDEAIDEIENLSGTDPMHPDSDRDGIKDGGEILWNLNPLDATDGGNTDFDNDGLSNAEEVSRGIGPIGYAPQIHNLAFDKKPEAGADLGLTYQFYDRDFAEEGRSTITWHIGDATFVQPRIIPSSDDIGKTIHACVIPESLMGSPSVGEETCTNQYIVQSSVNSWTGEGPVTITGRHDGNGVDLVVLGDGFTSDEMEKFKQTVLNFKTKFLGFHEIADHASGWNIHAVGMVSNESGVTDRSGEIDIEVDTYFNSCKGCGNLSRIVNSDGALAKSVAAEHFPQYDFVLMLVNSTKYGGVGGGIAVSTATPTSAGVSIHELGHLFGSLADEYGGSSAPPTTEPGSVNATINYDYATVKWKHWLEPTAHLTEKNGKVGLYEGGQYRNIGLWRPTLVSQMNGGGSAPFFAVNAEGWALKVYNKGKAIISHYPDTSSVYFHDKHVSPVYQIETIYDEGVQKIDWYLNDELVASGLETHYQASYIQEGSYTVKAVVTDMTGRIIKDEHSFSKGELTWQARAQ